jgi:hypothetical protein
MFSVELDPSLISVDPAKADYEDLILVSIFRDIGVVIC